MTTTGAARPMPTGVEIGLLRTAQEALANVARHAGASRVGVTLSYIEHEVGLDVRDDGRGFDRREAAPRPSGARPAPTPAPTPAPPAWSACPSPMACARPLQNPTNPAAFGLIGMRQRAESLGGTLEIESERGSGTGGLGVPPGGGARTARLVRSRRRRATGESAIGCSSPMITPSSGTG